MATTSELTPNNTAAGTEKTTPTAARAAEASGGAVSPLIAKLAGLRAKYFDELQAARDKAKQNFLK